MCVHVHVTSARTYICRYVHACIVYTCTCDKESIQLKLNVQRVRVHKLIMHFTVERLLKDTPEMKTTLY